VKDIIQQNYEAMPNLQYGYNRSSMLSSLQSDQQEDRNGQFLGVQHIFSSVIAGISGEISGSSAARILNSFGGSSSSVKVDPRLSEPARSVSTAGL
jgi:hypothetical protein